jgi:serine protease
MAVGLAVHFGVSAQAALAAPLSTGNVVVLLDNGPRAAAVGGGALEHVIRRVGAQRAGLSVPEIGLVTLRPPAGMAISSFIGELRALPGVASVQPEHRYVVRSTPNDPALTAPSAYSGTVEWELAREGLYDAWNVTHGNGATVAVIDTGIAATHPDLASKIAAAINQQEPSDARGTARTDEVGHGTHVASLACAATNNGIGMAGAGYNCRLVIEKSDFSDSSIAASIVDAANRHVDAINMSFGPESANPPPAPQSEVRALDYAAARKVVLVAAAADSPGTEQGDPANVLQPAGTGADLNKGIGLDVTAADYSDQLADFAGSGSEISLAAYGQFEPGEGGPPLCTGAPGGIFGAFPANLTDFDAELAVCRTTMNGASYAYLEGTSMAAPQVAGVAAMMRALNPYATLKDILRTLKVTARRPAGSGFSNQLGWGILDAAAAINRIRRIDRLPPVSRLIAPRVAHRLVFRLHWNGHDQRRAGLIASGIAYFLVYAKSGGGRPRLLARTRAHSLRFHAQRGHRYTFYVVAVDHAGNRQRHSRRETTRVGAKARW